MSTAEFSVLGSSEEICSLSLQEEEIERKNEPEEKLSGLAFKACLRELGVRCRRAQLK